MSAGTSLDTAVEVLPGAGDEAWYRIDFPENAEFRRHGSGVPRVRFVTNSGNVFRMDIRSSCGNTMSCGDGGSANNRTDWRFYDTCTSANTNCKSRSTGWPSTVHVRVYRVASGSGCEQFQLRISR